jgi:HEAT repeat protein
MLSTERCEPGPVRVLLDRADRQIISIRAYVGPESALEATDLGRVRAQDAADFLLDIAARSEGRVGRDAIFPVTLADSASIVRGLVALARNQALARETRSSALTYIGRASQPAEALPPGTIEALTAIARDEADNMTVRRQAIATLTRLEHGAGIPMLVDFANQTNSTFLAREAMSALASSGDPRARSFLRTAVQRDDIYEDLRTTALRALGRQYATQQDAALLRNVYAKLTSDALRGSVIAAVADVGGAENVKWLLDLARGQDAIALRRAALDHAARAGAPIAQLAGLYPLVEDYQLKDALVAIYARSGERVAVDALMAIARNETNVNVRRRAVAALGKIDDPRVKDLLRELATR